MRPLADDADDLYGAAHRVRVARPFLPRRCGIGKVAVGESLVDDGDRRCVAGIVRAEVAALDERQAEHFEVARSDGAQRKFGRLTRSRGNRLAFDDRHARASCCR